MNICAYCWQEWKYPHHCQRDRIDAWFAKHSGSSEDPLADVEMPQETTG